MFYYYCSNQYVLTKIKMKYAYQDTSGNIRYQIMSYMQPSHISKEFVHLRPKEFANSAPWPTLESEWLFGSTAVMSWKERNTKWHQMTTLHCDMNQTSNPILNSNGNAKVKQVWKIRDHQQKRVLIINRHKLQKQSNETHLPDRGSHLLRAEDTWSHILHHLSQVEMFSKMVQ